jgi:hypothetical protein
MSNGAQSTVAQAIYANPQHCSFVRVVTELEGLLSRLRNNSLRTRWEYEDVVVFDIGEMRIVIGWSEDQTDDMPACLLVSVGPLPSAVDPIHDPSHELLCNRLMERIQTRYLPDAVLWRQLPLAIEPELVDALIDALPSIRDVLGSTAHPKPAPFVMAKPKAIVAARVPANDTPDLPKPAQSELQRVRAALYPKPAATERETVQMRLAAQAMNATLIVVWMPLGVAAMTYSLMKGEKIGFSARMMAVTGTLIAWSQTPFGQQVAAFASA